jgi:hypothetical protein
MITNKQVKDTAKKVFGALGIKDLKFRSSSNAEDLPGFNGAGLYDSFSGELGYVLLHHCPLVPSLARPQMNHVFMIQ